MKGFLIILILCGGMLTATAQTKAGATSKPDAGKELLLVDASCGQCQFDLPGKSCDLAIRINGKAYFVDGSNIDSHGDAHANDGFCNAVRKAKVAGEIKNGRFQASYFKLIPESDKDKEPTLNQ